MATDPSPVCDLVVQLSSYAALRDVQVCVHVSKPLLANVDFYTVANLCKRISLPLSIPRRIFKLDYSFFETRITRGGRRWGWKGIGHRTRRTWQWWSRTGRTRARCEPWEKSVKYRWKWRWEAARPKNPPPSWPWSKTTLRRSSPSPNCFPV